jgi:glycosyltransferase involved in cell wall biosynthesis
VHSDGVTTPDRRPDGGSTSTPRVSIVIPCFRRGRFLAAAVESALAQTHRDTEVVVVDDGSDDETDEVARSFGSRIRHLAQENAGVAAARNAGLAVATGELCLFLDADDLLLPTAVERLARAADGAGDRLCVMGYRTFVDSPDETTFASALPPPGATAFPHLVHDNFGPPHVFLAPTAMLRAIGGFDPAFRGCEDWHCWLRLAIAGARVVAVPEIGALYRDTPGSASKDRGWMLEGRAEVLLTAHRALAAASETRAAYGADLLRAERRVLRRLLAQRVGSAALRRRLRQSIEELTRAGVRVPASRTERLLAAVLGGASDRAYVALCRAFRPRWYENYRSGYL